MIAAVILAAGASTRFGSPKQLAVFEGERLLERAVRVAREAGCLPVIVVLGANAELIRRECPLGGVVVCENDSWREGMGSSLRVGIGAVEGCEGVVVMTCDMPAVGAEHLRSLGREGRVTASRYAGRNGVPAYFPAGAFSGLLELSGDGGARGLLKGAFSVDLVGGELDIDTPEDTARLALQN